MRRMLTAPWMRVASVSVAASMVLLAPVATAEADSVAAVDSVLPMGNCTGFLCGFVHNSLPSSYTVKIAELGVGSERCATDKGTFNCRTYWLPSGRTSKQIGIKDADAVTVENAAWTYGPNTWFAAGAWQKISDVDSRLCVMHNGHPACYQN